MNVDTTKQTGMVYRRCGRSGINLPAISLGLWQNFGGTDTQAQFRRTLRTAFTEGVIHIDLANNYGPPSGTAEMNFGQVLKSDLGVHRDELFISTKAGYTMWPGPYGDWGSKKYLMASLEQSLKRMQLEYVDVFYHHRPDAETPMEETMETLSSMVSQGKALYIGLSNYPTEQAERAFTILEQLGTRCLVHQPKYSMLVRTVEDGLLDCLERLQVGCIAFSPLAQGLLTNQYLHGIPTDSRARKEHFLKSASITPELIGQLTKLHELALSRGQSLAQMAIAWLLKDERVTSVLVGARNETQLLDSLQSLNNTYFTADELQQIDAILGHAGI